MYVDKYVGKYADNVLSNLSRRNEHEVSFKN